MGRIRDSLKTEKDNECNVKRLVIIVRDCTLVHFHEFVKKQFFLPNRLEFLCRLSRQNKPGARNGSALRETPLRKCHRGPKGQNTEKFFLNTCIYKTNLSLCY